MPGADDIVLRLDERDATRDFTLLADLAQQRGQGVTLELSGAFLARAADHLGLLVRPFVERQVFIRLRHDGGPLPPALAA